MCNLTSQLRAASSRASTPNHRWCVSSLTACGSIKPCVTRRRVRPNPSFKRTPNGLARLPGRIRFAHFMRPVQRAKPLGAA